MKVGLIPMCDAIMAIAIGRVKLQISKSKQQNNSKSPKNVMYCTVASVAHRKVAQCSLVCLVL